MGKIKQKKFNEILSTVTKAKNNGLRLNVDGREITLNNTGSLLKDIANETLDGTILKIGTTIFLMM